MNITECEKIAQDKGFDSMRFKLTVNGQTHNAQWLDAYFGAFLVDGFNGAFYSSDFSAIFHSCEIEP